MKCPFCQHDDSKVLDTRLNAETNVVRRRRECDECARRFSTFERVELVLPLVIKKDGGRQDFSRDKLLKGMRKACEKRPVSAETIESTVNNIERYFYELGEKEVPSEQIGEALMRSLKDIDDVAYVRFASVYHAFQDLDQFMHELQGLLGKRKA